jgi:acyl-CoA synthetase (AMP-forming)/AMP-acid ligase II
VPEDPYARSLSDLVRGAARRTPDATAVAGDAVLTWREVDAQVDAAAAALGGLGLRAGDRVGLCLGNVLAFPVAYFGSLRADLVAVPLNPAATAQELGWAPEADATSWEVLLTETSPVLTTTLMSELAEPGSIGRPVPGVELRLVDGSGAPVEEGDPGEVVVRGANVFAGYWPDGADGPDADGWFATGDVACLDEDGDLHLVDRRRELVLVSGHVHPREVEQVLVRHPEVVFVADLPHGATGVRKGDLRGLSA